MSVDEHAVSTVGRDPEQRVSIGFADPVYAEIMDFINREVLLLDRDLLYDWIDLLTEDCFYRIPARKTVPRDLGAGIDPNGGMPATKAALSVLARRNLETDYVYDQDPRPRIRRFVNVVGVYQTAKENEYEVECNVLLLRNQYHVPAHDLVSGERRDVLRKTDEGLRLAQRTVLLDAAVLASPIPNVIF